MLADDPQLDTIVVPVGGGGVVSGIATAVKAINPTIRIVAVEAKLFPSMYEAVHGLSPSSGGQSIADGIAVKSPGEITRPIIERLVDDMLVVDEPVLETAVQRLAEGAGAAPLAAVLANAELFVGRRVGLVTTGGNIDMRLLAAVLNRGLMRDGRLVRMRVGIADQPAMLAQVLAAIGGHGGNVIEVVHQRMFFDVPARRVEIDITVETRSAEHVHEIIDALRDAAFDARVLSTRSRRS